MHNQLKTLTSLAILKVDLDERRDYLGYLESFVLQVLNVHRPNPVVADAVSELLREDFGLNVPSRGTQLVLRRLARKGHLRKEHNLFHIETALPQVNFGGKQVAARRDIESVYSSLREFAAQHQLNWSDREIAEALITFLGQFGVEFLRAYIFKTALPRFAESGPRDIYIVSKFVRNLYETRDPVFDCMSVLVKGHMLANALVCPDLESLDKKFGSLTIYLDTPLVLNLFGLQGEQNKSATAELLYLVRQLRGTIAVFEHTVDEVRRVLSYVEKNFDNHRADGEVLREARKIGIRRSDLILLKEGIHEELGRLNLVVKPTPAYKEKYQVSEADLQGAIESQITYKNPNALVFDINSVRSIYVLREGATPRRLEDAVAVFVTPNALLARAAFEVGQKHTSTKEVSSVITDYSLANIAWLKAPLGAPELPTKEMLAACYAAMEPSAPLWSRYLGEIDLLSETGKISPEDHAILRASPIAIEELMNLTLGDEEALTSGSIQTIIGRVKESLVKEKDEALEVERSEKIRITSERDRVQKQVERAKQNLYWQTETTAKWVVFAIELTFLLLLGLSAVAPALADTLKPASKFGLGLINVGAIFGATWLIASGYYGVSVKQLLPQIRMKIHVFLYRRSVRKLGWEHDKVGSVEILDRA